MPFKPIAPETRQCKGCGVDFVATDDRNWFHRKGCGRRRGDSNAWLLANRPNFPTEPCRKCGKPVVQYRTRRYEREMRYCGRSCQPHPELIGPSKQELVSAKAWSSKCRHCAKRLRSGYTSCQPCYEKRDLALLRLYNRFRWLLPKQCTGCGELFNQFSSGWKCKDCKDETYRQWRHIRRLRTRGEGTYDPGISYTVLFRAGDGRCALCNEQCQDPSVWKTWDGKTYMPLAPTLDHIIPLAKGGTHTLSNAQLACVRCNSHKGDRPYPRGFVILENVGGTLSSAESHAGTGRLA